MHTRAISWPGVKNRQSGENEQQQALIHRHYYACRPALSVEQGQTKKDASVYSHLRYLNGELTVEIQPYPLLGRGASAQNTIAVKIKNRTTINTTRLSTSAEIFH